MKTPWFALMLMISGAALAGDKEQLAKLLALTPEHFQAKADIKDSSLDTSATISTLDGFQVKHGLLKILWDDSFLRGIIDKKTGTVRIQVYQYMYYTGDWRFYNRATYETPNGPVDAKFIEISRDVLSCSGARYGSGCSHVEQFGFEVDEALLRAIAANYRPGASVAWQFKFFSKSGADWMAGLTPAEVVGFLRALDSYRSSHNLPAYSPVTAGTTAGNSAGGVTASKPNATTAEMNSEFRRKAKAAIDRGDIKAAQEWLDMIVE